MIGLNTADTVKEAGGFDASAVQIVQLYTEGLFWFLRTIGLAVSGYIITRMSL